jgi:hypothetical protein
LVDFLRKTVNIHPSADKIVRLVQIRLLKIGYDYDYSAALNGVIVANMFLGLEKGKPDAQIVRNVRDFIANMDTSEISEETLQRYEEYVRNIDLVLEKLKSEESNRPPMENKQK